MVHRVVPRVQSWLRPSMLVFQLFLLPHKVGTVSAHILLLNSSFSYPVLRLPASPCGACLHDPAQSFLLNLVHFSESAPLLLFAVNLLLGIAIGLFLTAAVGLAGTTKMERCLLSGFITLLLLLLLAKMGVLLLAFLFRTKFHDEYSMTEYLANISRNRYNRDRWVLPLMDSIQYYGQCCGGHNARDYYDSFWYLTNTERGSRSFVPWSCCRQSQEGRAWALQPIDPLCIQYPYGSRAFNASVNWKGCGQTTKEHLDWLIGLLALTIGLTALVDLFGIVLAVKCLRQVCTFYNAILRL